MYNIKKWVSVVIRCWWIEYVAVVIMTGSAAFLSINIYVWVIFGLSAWVYLAIKRVHERGKPNSRDLEKELEQYKQKYIINTGLVRDLLNGYLYNLASNLLKFGEKSKNTERISLYIHSNGNFVCFGRYSANPEYKNPSRTSYPDNEGCIAKGWQHGWFFDNSFPSSKVEYAEYCLNKYKMPLQTTNNINMKSKCFAVLAIKRSETPLGVIVLETIEQNRFQEKDIKEKIKVAK